LASLVQTLTDKGIELFAIMSGDVNRTHVDEEFARSDVFHEVVAHGIADFGPARHATPWPAGPAGLLRARTAAGAS
jgi:acyl dehydratase